MLHILVCRATVRGQGPGFESPLATKLSPAALGVVVVETPPTAVAACYHVIAPRSLPRAHTSLVRGSSDGTKRSGLFAKSSRNKARSRGTLCTGFSFLITSTQTHRISHTNPKSFSTKTTWLPTTLDPPSTKTLASTSPRRRRTASSSRSSRPCTSQARAPARSRLQPFAASRTWRPPRAAQPTSN